MPRSARLAVGALGIALLSLYLWHAMSRLSAVHHQTYDLALYSRLAWGVAGGDAWVSIRDTNFLAAHTSLVLIPLGLLGRLIGTPVVLLTAQALCLAAVVVPLSRMGARRFGGRGAVAAALLWALYPNLGHVAAYEFHPGNLGILPLAWALDALDRRDGRALWRWAACAVACRADFALITLLLGVVAMGSAPGDGLRDSGRRLLVASMGYFAVVVLLVPSLISGGVPSTALHFARWGGNPLGVLPALLSRPQDVIAHFAAPERLRYPFMVLGPLLLLPLLRPRLLLLALPPLALNLISEFPTTVHLYSHYLTPAIPILIYAALDAVAGLSTRRRPVALAACVLAAAVGSIVAGGHPWSLDYPAAAFAQDDATAARRAVLEQIPDGASVQAPDSLLPHLSQRSIVHRSPPPERGTDFVVLDIAHRQRFAGSATLLRTQQEPGVRTWLARTDHGLILARGGLLLLRRGADPRGGPLRKYFVGGVRGESAPRLTACLAVLGAHLSGDELSLQLRAEGPCPSDLAIRIGARDRPSHVQLLFDGLLSPAHLQSGDGLRSVHRLPARLAAEIAEFGLYIGALRTSGSPPSPSDPYALRVNL